MAVDHALFEQVQRAGLPVLRFYRWTPACLSLGRNQAALPQKDRIAGLGVDLVRRPTGGLAVWHDQELTYSVAVPVGLLGSPRATYQAINRALLAGLQALGVSAEALRADNTRAAFRDARACFAGTAPGELGVGGLKMIGSAQRCERRTILQHGSILLDGDQSAADLGQSRQQAPATVLRHVLGYAPDWLELVSAFRQGFQRELGIALAPATLDSEARARSGALTEFYAATEWTWRC